MVGGTVRGIPVVPGTASLANGAASKPAVTGYRDAAELLDAAIPRAAGAGRGQHDSARGPDTGGCQRLLWFTNLVGIFALASAYVICVRRPWWERGLLLLSALPVALVANSARIVVTGLLYQYVSGEAAQKFSHDVSGWVSIPFAALLFAGVLWYLGKVFREIELVDIGSVVRRERLRTSH